MSNAEYLLVLLKEIHTYSKSPDFDRKHFDYKSKNFYNIYKRYSNEDQGEFHHLWHEFLKRKTQ